MTDKKLIFRIYIYFKKNLLELNKEQKRKKRYFTKRDVQLANEYMKRGSKSLGKCKFKL